MILQIYALLQFIHICHSVDIIYTIEEEKDKNTYLGDIIADLGLKNDPNLMNYRWLQQHSMNNDSILFHVSEKTGKMFTAKVFDAETLCHFNIECFRMVDIVIQKANSFIKLLEVKVIIKDINDHGPEFPNKEFSLEFSEDDRKGAKRALPNAIDLDISKKNSLITYHLMDNSDQLFALSVITSFDGTSKLSIILQEQLDRELKDFYQIQVIAKDGGSPVRQSVLKVNITVTDVNDNAPVFTQNVYNVTVTNGKTSVVFLKANDLDSGKNGRLFYQFNYKTSQTAKDHFALNGSTGEISLFNEFSLGKSLIHRLYVDAIDEGNPPLSSTAILQINVINQNNSPPTIEVNFVVTAPKNEIEIFEDIEVGSFIAYVKVTDYDAGQNGRVSCDVNHNQFELRALGLRKYKIVVKHSLDRETKDHYNISIRCKDHGSPALEAEKIFSIRIMDVNDERPKLEKKDYKFFLKENQDAHSLIGSINATDSDLGENGKISFSLLHNIKEFFPFQISQAGLITTTSSLDHESKDSYEFQVLVKDNGTHPLNSTGNVCIEIQDENDNAPYFIFPKVNPFYYNFPYYPHHTKNITFIRAIDKDSRENAFLKYEIIRGNQQLFAIDQYSGQLTFSHVALEKHSGFYRLDFLVKDSGVPILSATTVLYLTLTANNKSSEKAKPIPTQTDDKINILHMIIVTFGAVIVSVIITASISICIIRYTKRSNIPRPRQMGLFDRCVHKDRDSVCFSYMTNSWSDVPISGATNQVLPEMNHLPESRKGSQHFLKDPCENHKCLKQSKTLDSIYKICEPPEKYEKGTHSSPGYFTWKSDAQSSCINHKNIECEAEDKELDSLQVQNSVYNDGIDNSQAKRSEESFIQPYDTTISTMYFYKPVSRSKSSFKMDAKNQVSSTFEERNSNALSDINIDTSNASLSSVVRPLPPVPKVPKCPKHK